MGNSNGNIYMQESISTWPGSFTEQHHSDGQYLFFSELVASGYVA